MNAAQANFKTVNSDEAPFFPLKFLQQNNSATVERMRIASNGNIGISRTIPSTKLVIQGVYDASATASAIYGNAANKGIELICEKDGSWPTGYTYGIDFGAKDAIDGTNHYQIAAIYAAVEDVPYQVTGLLKFYTTSGASASTLEERMTILGSGNVGINCTPTYKLHVNGTTYFDGASIVNGQMTAGLGHFQNSSHTIVTIKAHTSGDKYSMLQMTSNGTQDNYIRADVGDLVIDGSHTSGNITKALAVTGALTGTSAAFSGNISTSGTGTLTSASSLTAGGTLYVDENIRHSGDTNNYINFTTDTQKFYTDNALALTIDSSQAATFSGDVSVGGNLAVTGTIDCDTLDGLDSSQVLQSGQDGAYYTFNGVNDYVEIPDLRPVVSADATMAAWGTVGSHASADGSKLM